METNLASLQGRVKRIHARQVFLLFCFNRCFFAFALRHDCEYGMWVPVERHRQSPAEESDVGLADALQREYWNGSDAAV